MDTKQVIIIKRVATCVAVGLMVLSLGLMLLGWTVPTKSAFDAGVFGFQLFPIAVLAVLIRITFPLIAKTSLGRAIIGLTQPVIQTALCTSSWVRNRISSPVTETNTEVGRSERNRQCSEDLDFIDASSPLEDAFRDPLRHGLLNTCPMHMDPISNPDGYIPDYDAIFDEEESGP